MFNSRNKVNPNIYQNKSEGNKPLTLLKKNQKAASESAKMFFDLEKQSCL